jgi:hypothetical protein
MELYVSWVSYEGFSVRSEYGLDGAQRAKWKVRFSVISLFHMAYILKQSTDAQKGEVRTVRIVGFL